MTNNLIKSITLYLIIIIMLSICKPSHFYYDTKCTRMKKWDLYRETNNPHDMINFYSCAIIIAIICYLLCKNI